MKNKIITAILTLSLILSNAVIPVFAENEDTAVMPEQVEVVTEEAQETLQEETPSDVAISSEEEIPMQDDDETAETEQLAFDAPLFDAPVLPKAEDTAGPAEDFELFSNDFSLMATSTKYGDYLYYTVNDAATAVTISDCDTSAREIDIPSEIDGISVTSIGSSAFERCYGLTNVTMHNEHWT